MNKHLNKTKAGFFLLILLLAAFGCSTVVANHPIGKKLTKVDSLNLSGVWQLKTNDKKAQFIYVNQRAEGKLDLALVEFKDGKFKLNKFKADITKNSDVYYLNFPYKNEQTKSKKSSTQKSKKEAKRNGYTFARIIPRKNMLIVIPANKDYFESAIKNDLLKGRINSGKNKTTKIFLQDSAKTVDDFISPDRLSEQFNLDDSLILKRVSNIEDNPKDKDD